MILSSHCLKGNSMNSFKFISNASLLFYSIFRLTYAVEQTDMRDWNWSTTGTITGKSCTKISFDGKRGWLGTYLCTKKNHFLKVKMKNEIKDKDSCLEIYGVDADFPRGKATNPWLCSDLNQSTSINLKDEVKFSSSGVITSGGRQSSLNNWPSPLSLKCINIHADNTSSTMYLCGQYTVSVINGGGNEKPVLDQANDIFPIDENIKSRFYGAICDTNPTDNKCAVASTGRQRLAFPGKISPLHDWIPFNNIAYYSGSLEDPISLKRKFVGAYRFKRGGFNSFPSIKRPAFPPSAVAYYVDPITRNNGVTSLLLTSNNAELRSTGSGTEFVASIPFANAPDSLPKPYANCSSKDPISCKSKLRIMIDIKINQAYMYPYGENYLNGHSGSTKDPFPESPKLSRPSSIVGLMITLQDPSAGYFNLGLSLFNQGRSNESSTFVMFESNGHPIVSLRPDQMKIDGVQIASQVPGTATTMFDLPSVDEGFKHFEITVTADQLTKIIAKMNEKIDFYNSRHSLSEQNKSFSTDISTYKILSAGITGEIFVPSDNTGYCTKDFTTYKTPSGGVASTNKCFVALAYSIKNFRLSYQE